MNCHTGIQYGNPSNHKGDIFFLASMRWPISSPKKINLLPHGTALFHCHKEEMGALFEHPLSPLPP